MCSCRNSERKMKRKIKVAAANLITGARIILSLVMLIFPVFSKGFYACYLLAGFTDMIDGTIARKLGTESEFGSKFDTVADIVFVAAAGCKLLPALEISMAIWIWTGLIAIIKVVNIILGFVIQKKYVAVHSVTNKITGAVLFVLPLTISFVEIKYSAMVVCLLATSAAVQEGHLIKKNALVYGAAPQAVRRTGAKAEQRYTRPETK